MVTPRGVPAPGAAIGAVVSVNVGRVEPVEWRGRTIHTAFRKRPVEGPREVGALGLDGDVQGDRRVHGGVDKAVYSYAVEHHPFWREELGPGIGAGSFGENLATRGLLEDEVRIGDRYRVGGALLEVSEPRQPCSTFAAVHRRAELPRVFAEAGWSGLYFRVLEEGAIAAGDAIALERRGDARWTVRRVFEWVMGRGDLPADLDDLLADPTLARSTAESLARRRGAR